MRPGVDQVVDAPTCRPSATSPTRPTSTGSPSTTRVAAHRGEQLGVLAGQADGERAVLVDQADQLAADLADEHHPDDVHRLGRGDPQAAAELAGDAEPVEHRGDLRAAAVHDDRLDAGVAQEHHVGGERPLQLGVDHRVAAVLDDDGGAVEPLQPRQRLDERRRPCPCAACRQVAAAAPATVGALMSSTPSSRGRTPRTGRWSRSSRSASPACRSTVIVHVAAGQVDLGRGPRRPRRPGRPTRR